MSRTVVNTNEAAAAIAPYSQGIVANGFLFTAGQIALDPATGQIVGDEFSINEMITNLLFNAIKYTPENKTIRIEAKSCDGRIQIDISDTGIGIPKDEISNVFDEFFRASNAVSREKDGTGLGLSIVKQIVVRHGGEISVQSQQDQGSTFTVLLPTDSSTSVC